MKRVSAIISLASWLSLLAMLWLFTLQVIPFSWTNWAMFILFLIIGSGSSAAYMDHSKHEK